MCNDPRLGPVQLPTAFPLRSFVSDYDRFGGQPRGEFLAKWTDPKTGKYKYPPQDGFQLDVEGKPIKGNMTLLPGTKLDRFGSEYGRFALIVSFLSYFRCSPLLPRSTSPNLRLGSFISAADSPYAQRALPPSSLDTSPLAPDYPYSYHVYVVEKELPVLGGPIAPWFGQPGLGAQFYIGDAGNVLQLIEKGFLVRHKGIGTKPGPRRGKGCW